MPSTSRYTLGSAASATSGWRPRRGTSTGPGRLGEEFSDDLRLVLNDLGWGDGPGRTIELTTPPDVLRRVISRVQASAIGQRESEEPEWARARDQEEHSRLVVEACETVMQGLDASEQSAG